MCNLQIIIQAFPGSRSDCQVNTNEIVAFFMCLVSFFEGGDLQEKERVFIHRDITVIRWHLRSTSRYWTNRKENKITHLYAYAMALLTAQMDSSSWSINLIVTYFPLELKTDLFWIGREGNKIKNHRLQWWIKAKNCLGCQILYQ